MTSALCKNTLDQCITHLVALKQDDWATDEDTILLNCISGLQEISGQWGSYGQSIKIANKFSGFLGKNIEAMLAYLQSELAKEQEQHYNKINEFAFAIIEEVAVLMREHYLRTGCLNVSEGEHALMNYFESSGLWQLGDGTMVSEYYYVTLPIAVMAELVSKMAESSKAV